MIERDNLLFQKELIYVEDLTDIHDVFDKMAQRFLEQGLVKSSYLAALKEREQLYPTGIDLSVFGENLPNVAIPHTEREHCLTTRVILVKLKHGIDVHNMMNPSQILKNVKYLFMILNGLDVEQTDILGKIMAIVTDINTINSLEQAGDIEALYTVLKNYI